MPEILSKKLAIDRLSEKIGYHKYECEDFIEGFYELVKEELLKGNQIVIEGVVKFHIERVKRKKIYSSVRKQLYLSSGRKRVAFKVNEKLKRQIYLDMDTPHFIDHNEKGENVNS